MSLSKMSTKAQIYQLESLLRKKADVFDSEEKSGTIHICVDYCPLNKVTEAPSQQEMYKTAKRK